MRTHQPMPHSHEETARLALTRAVLSGPTATAILSPLSRHTLWHYIFQSLGRCRRRIALHPVKRPFSTYLFSSYRGCRTSSCLLEGLAVQGGCRSYTVDCRAAVGRLGAILVPLARFWASPHVLSPVKLSVREACARALFVGT